MIAACAAWSSCDTADSDAGVGVESASDRAMAFSISTSSAPFIEGGAAAERGLEVGVLEGAEGLTGERRSRLAASTRGSEAVGREGGRGVLLHVAGAAEAVVGGGGEGGVEADEDGLTGLVLGDADADQLVDERQLSGARR